MMMSVAVCGDREMVDEDRNCYDSLNGWQNGICTAPLDMEGSILAVAFLSTPIVTRGPSITNLKLYLLFEIPV